MSHNIKAKYISVDSWRSTEVDFGQVSYLETLCEFWYVAILVIGLVVSHPFKLIFSTFPLPPNN